MFADQNHAVFVQGRIVRHPSWKGKGVFIRLNAGAIGILGVNRRYVSASASPA